MGKLQPGPANPQALNNCLSAGVQMSIKRKSLGSLLVWSTQVYINTMLRGKDKSSGLREGIVAVHQSGKDYKTIPNNLRVQYFTGKKISQVERIQDCWQSSQE